MGALADRLDGRLGGAHQLSDLAVRQFRVELDQPQDRRRSILALGQRGVPRAATLFFAYSSSIELQFQLVHRAGLGRVDLFLSQLVIGDRVKPFHASRHVAIGDALNFQLVQPDEICDLLEADRGVVDQPDGGCFRHNRFCHLVVSFKVTFPVACRDRRHLFGVRVSVVGELERYIVRQS